MALADNMRQQHTACHCCKHQPATGRDTLVKLAFCGTVCQAGYYLHALIGAGDTKRDRAALLPDEFVILRDSLQEVGGDAELEAALERVEEDRSDENIEHFKQVATRVIPMLDRRFSAVPALERGMLALFKDAIASYLGTEPSEAGRVYGFGSNTRRQLGKPDGWDHVSSPVPILSTEDITDISCGSMHTGLVSKDGRVYTAGSSDFGKLGHGGVPRLNSVPFAMLGLQKVMTISCGINHTGLVTREGVAYTFGLGYSGQLGQGVIRELTEPRPLIGLSPISSISCGGSHTGMVTRDGRVYTFGSSLYGRLGNGIQDDDSYVPTEIFGLPPITAISCGAGHTGIVTRDGRVYTFGINEYGQAGHEQAEPIFEPFEIQDIPRVLSISCGTEHSGLVTLDGRAYLFGANSHGQLGNGHDIDRRPQQIPELTNVASISCGSRHTGLVTRTGALYMFGDNMYGQLGKGHTRHDGSGHRPEPIHNLPPVVSVSCGGPHTLVLTKIVVPRFPFNLSELY
jgi:Regulator of chromosome condensation (RCC1) repeat